MGALLLLILLSIFSPLIEGMPNKPLNAQDRSKMIFIRGKWFSLDGKNNLIVPQQQTAPQLFQQCMDHGKSDGCDTKWPQRYWIRDDYYVPGGPIFFQFGGEAPADFLIDYYYWHEYAKEYNALLVVLEHRFYGDSWPTFDDSFESLQLLTSQQALADAAYFIDEYNKDNNLTGSNWVAFGGSYAGNLAAWMKQKYPNHVKTAVASSGPLEAVYDFPGYLGTVSEVVQAIDPICYERIGTAFSCMESLVNTSLCGIYTHPSQMLPILHQCFLIDFNNRLDRETFFNILAMGDWAENWPSQRIRDNCAVLNDAQGSNPLERYGDFLSKIGSGQCRNTWGLMTEQKRIHEFIHSKEGKQSGAAGWFWQTCYEFGYYMSCDPKLGLFGYDTFSGDPYGVSCLEEYGPVFTKSYIEERISETNVYYKGKDIDSKCVIFVNGEWDPWHPLGINHASETSPNNTVVYVPKAEHCDDMLNPLTEDMRLAQEKIATQIGLYLNDVNC